MNKIIKDKSILEKNIYNNIINNNCIEDNDNILIAVSGGSDSMMLLNYLYTFKDIFKNESNIKYNIAVAHVNHLLREESLEEMEYVEQFCLNRNIKFFKLEVDINKLCKQKNLGTEECARKVRYKFFNDICNEYGYNKIALAHNNNDNVETILLNIIRGSGTKGLCGIQYKFENLIRPLIEISKENINNYCELNNIKYYIDKSNFENNYTRNKVRNKLIPYLKEEYNNNFEEAIIRLSQIVRLDEDFFDNHTEELIKKYIINETDNEIIINFKNLINEHESIKNRIIRKIIYKLLNNVDGVEKIHVKDIIKLLESNITNKKFILGNKFTVIITKKNTAKFKTNLSNKF